MSRLSPEVITARSEGSIQENCARLATSIRREVKAGIIFWVQRPMLEDGELGSPPIVVLGALDRIANKQEV